MDGWCVYSFGGGLVIWKILNAVAMLCANNSEYFTPVLKLSAGIGAIWAAVRAIWKSNVGIFGKSWFVPTYIMLSVLFIPKASIWIVDRTDPSFVARKVDNIPLGLAAIAGSTSTFCYHLTELIEKVFVVHNDENLRYTTTGPMFAAKLVAMSRDLRIADPIQRQNVKDFVKQCYMWPYVFSNIEPGTTAAQQSNNILEFVEANPHPGLGIYWRNEHGRSEFTNCAQCVPRVRAMLNLQRTRPFTQLARDLWSGGLGERDDAQLAGQMKVYADSGWNYISRGAQDAYQQTGQQMMINAYREALDDQREAAGAPRLHPRLVNSSSTRGLEQQNAGFLVGGAMAAEHLPSVQAVLLGMLLLMFIFVIPASMLPGGIRVMGLWTKAIFWVQSWPIFYAILHAIGMMFYQRSALTILIGNGDGLNLLTYSGIADVAWNSYCAVQNMFLTIPVLSWGVFSGSGYMINQIASSLAPTQGASLGAGIADGNQTFDTQAMHTRAMQSFQIGQQQLRPGFSMASSINDGNFNRMTSVTGETSFQENLSNTKVSQNMQQILEKGLSQAINENDSIMQTLSTERANQATDTGTQAWNILESIAKGDVTVTGYSQNENRAAQEMAQKAIDERKQFTHNDQLADSSNAQVNAGGNIGGAFAKILGANVGGGTQVTADNQDLSQLSESAGISEQSAESVTKVLQSAINKGVTAQTSETANQAESFNKSASRLVQLGEKESAARSRQESLSRAQSFMEKNGANLSVNQTDSLLQKFGDTKFAHLHAAAERKTKAAEFARRNPLAFANAAAPMMEEVFTKNYGGAHQAPSFDSNYQMHKSAVEKNHQQNLHEFDVSAKTSLIAKANHAGLTRNNIKAFRTEKETLKKAVQKDVATKQPRATDKIRQNMKNRRRNTHKNNGIICKNNIMHNKSSCHKGRGNKVTTSVIDINDFFKPIKTHLDIIFFCKNAYLLLLGFFVEEMSDTKSSHGGDKCGNSSVTCQIVDPITRDKPEQDRQESITNNAYHSPLLLKTAFLVTNIIAQKALCLQAKHSAALSQHESLARAKSYIEKNGANLTMNQTDSLLQKIGDIKFRYLSNATERKRAAADFERNSPTAFANMAAPLIAETYSKEFANKQHVPELEKNYQADANAIRKEHLYESAQLNSATKSEIDAKAQSRGLEQSAIHDLKTHIQDRKTAVQNKVSGSLPSTNKKTLDDLNKKHETRKSKTTLRRAVAGDVGRKPVSYAERRARQERARAQRKERARS